MSASSLTALFLLVGALLLAAAALAVGRLLRPPPGPVPEAEPAADDMAGVATHSWHLVALGALFQLTLVLLLAWGLIFRDLARAGSPALLGLLVSLLIVTLALAQAWRHGLLDAGTPADIGDPESHGDVSR